MSSERERNMELEIGKQICQADLKTMENEKQLREYRRERFGKEMREAW